MTIKTLAACGDRALLETMTISIALVGDVSSHVIAHRAIPLALERANSNRLVNWTWVPTRAINDAAIDLAPFAAIWLVPGSPYENMNGALAAVRFARETHRPFLGTCGGFQHALIEFARNVAGLATADHAESNPDADTLVISPLACSLVEQTGFVRLAPGSLIRAAYGSDAAREGYHCNYGLNHTYRDTLERAGILFTAFDAEGQVRAAELPQSTHPFFVGTLFQPARAALRGDAAPLVSAFVAATVRCAGLPAGA